MNSIAKKTFVVAVFLMVFGLAVSLPAAAQNPLYPVILHPEQEGQHHKDHTLDLGTQGLTLGSSSLMV